jgi:hypothetical protein
LFKKSKLDHCTHCSIINPSTVQFDIKEVPRHGHIFNAQWCFKEEKKIDNSVHPLIQTICTPFSFKIVKHFLDMNFFSVSVRSAKEAPEEHQRPQCGQQ